MNVLTWNRKWTCAIQCTFQVQLIKTGWQNLATDNTSMHQSLDILGTAQWKDPKGLMKLLDVSSSMSLYSDSRETLDISDSPRNLFP